MGRKFLFKGVYGRFAEVDHDGKSGSGRVRRQGNERDLECLLRGASFADGDL
jgi:hypothetical protein